MITNRFEYTYRINDDPEMRLVIVITDNHKKLFGTQVGLCRFEIVDDLGEHPLMNATISIERKFLTLGTFVHELYHFLCGYEKFIEKLFDGDAPISEYVAELGREITDGFWDEYSTYESEVMDVEV